jgi:hypothetical protein
VRENKPDSLALNPYLLFLCFNARSSSSGVANVAFPLSHSPLGFPLMPDGTMRTFELFRRRLTLPVSLLAVSQAGLVNNLIFGVSWGLFTLYFVSFGISVNDTAFLKALHPRIWGVLAACNRPT